VSCARRASTALTHGDRDGLNSSAARGQGATPEYRQSDRETGDIALSSGGHLIGATAGGVCQIIVVTIRPRPRAAGPPSVGRGGCDVAARGDNAAVVVAGVM
jgi:hypothetical protein